MTRDDALRYGAGKLKTGGISTPLRDARALLLGAAEIDAARLVSHGDAPLSSAQNARYDDFLERRLRREPVSKILGKREFFGLEFEVTPDVLDPRPDSETLVMAALDHARPIVDRGNDLKILDLGTGSGCLLLALLSALPSARGLGVDESQAALDVARRNAERQNLATRADFLRSDWLEKVDGTFAIVVSNPPYLRKNEAAALESEVRDWDPPQALFAGKDGLEAYRRIAEGLSRALSETGTAVFEVGAGQAGAVMRLFADNGFEIVGTRRDLAGIERCVIISRSS